MPIPFSKYSGCGNDFILIDNRGGVFPINRSSLIKQLCERRTGIGADGLILLENSATAQFRMRIYNADGSEAEMCGNGIRCLMKFLAEIEPQHTTCTFQTASGNVKTRIVGDEVEAAMPLPQDIAWNIHLPLAEKLLTLHRLNTGVPHAVIFVDELEASHWMEFAPHIRHHSDFGNAGTNVNFAKLEGQFLRLRTYERGVEGETLACGTGATAVALAAAKIYGLQSPVTLYPASGEMLQIGFKYENSTFSDILMRGPARYIYKGELVL